MTGTLLLTADKLAPLNRLAGALRMSIRLMTKVWDSSCYEGGTLLVLLALADWANDDGDRLFPHMAQIAKRARLCERQARRVLRDLERDGVLIPKTNKTGGRGNRVEYKINLESMTKCPPLSKGGHPELERGTSTTVKADICDTERRTSTTLKGDICDNPPTPPYIDNRQENHQEEPPSEPSSDHQEVRAPIPSIIAPLSTRDMLSRICEILGVKLQDDPSRVTWGRQLEAMIQDGLDFQKDIIPATEVARVNGMVSMNYIRACALRTINQTGLAKSAPKEGNHEPRASNYGRPEKISPHDKYARAAHRAACILDGRDETGSSA